jgi:hypothetical protein
VKSIFKTHTYPFRYTICDTIGLVPAGLIGGVSDMKLKLEPCKDDKSLRLLIIL